MNWKKNGIEPTVSARGLSAMRRLVMTPRLIGNDLPIGRVCFTFTFSPRWQIKKQLLSSFF